LCLSRFQRRFTRDPAKVSVIWLGALIGGSFLLGLGEWIRPTTANAQAPMTSNRNPPPVNISGGDNVVSIGQIGGITARIVTINPPMRPELRILEKSEIDNPDGTHTVIIKTKVASPITPGLLVVQIDAVGIRNVSIIPPPINGVSGIELRNVRRTYSAEIQSPRGQYDIVIQTNSAAPISLNATFYRILNQHLLRKLQAPSPCPRLPKAS
jgi:hypothetical protein